MAVIDREDLERGQNDGLQALEEPLFSPTEKKIASNHDCCNENADGGGSIGMVLMCTLVAVCGSFEFGSCVGFSSPAQSAIRNDLKLSLSEYSMFGSIVTIGAMFGAIASGRIADFIGRKGAMRLSSVSCILGWLAVYFSVGAWLLDIGRLFTGYGIGVFSYVVPVYIAEVAPTNLRGGLTTANQLMIVCGSSVAFLIGTVVSWRTLALTGLLPCVALLLGLCFIPESPRWLAKVGREKEFKAALQRLRGSDADISAEAAEIQSFIESLQGLPRAKMLDLFQSRYIRSVMIGFGLMAAQQFGGINGVNFYVSETFVMAGFSSGKVGTIAYACIQVPVTIVGAILMDKSGRRPLLLVSTTGTFLGCFIIGTSFLLKSNSLLVDVVPFTVIAGMLIYIAFFSIGLGAVPWVIMSEIFPINVKGIGGSMVVLVNWLGAWLVSFTFNYLMNWSHTGTFFVYAGFSALTILFVANIVPETKGKTLEEIQASING